MSSITALGVGSAFAHDNFQSNMLLEIAGQKLLIDAGSDLKRSLRFSNYSHRDLHAVYVSHLHSDHMGGMEYLGLNTMYDSGFVDAEKRKRKLKLFLHRSLKTGMWQSLKHGMALPGEKATLEKYFDVDTCKNDSFTFAGTKFELVRTVHFLDNADIAPSYGLRWQSPGGKKVLLSTDTVLIPMWCTLFAHADVILHDCETSAFRSPVHAHYEDLKKLPADVKAKMWLYHYQDGPKSDATADGFAGWLMQGQKIDLG